jgi:hypothetical protein
MANTPAPPPTTAPPTPTTPPPATSSASMGAKTVVAPVEVLNNPLIGKYVFVYDYQTTVYTPEARQIIARAGTAKYTLPKDSFFKLKYSKGDVVDVINFGRPASTANTAPLPPSPNMLVINVPKFVNPLGGTKGFAKTLTIDNTNGFLKKVANSTAVSVKYGVNFGRNPNPKATTPAKTNNPASTPKTNKPSTTSTGNTPSNAVTAKTEQKGFFESKNNLIMVGVALVVGYLLFNSKSE